LTETQRLGLATVDVGRQYLMRRRTGSQAVVASTVDQSTAWTDRHSSATLPCSASCKPCLACCPSDDVQYVQSVLRVRLPLCWRNAAVSHWIIYQLHSLSTFHTNSPRRCSA